MDEDNDYFREYGIVQIYISDKLKKIYKDIFYDYYNLNIYKNKYNSTLFVGILNIFDKNIIAEHNDNAYLLLTNFDLKFIEQYENDINCFLNNQKIKHIFLLHNINKMFNQDVLLKTTIINTDLKLNKMIEDFNSKKKYFSDNNYFLEIELIKYSPKELYSSLNFTYKVNMVNKICPKNISSGHLSFDPYFTKQCIKNIPNNYRDIFDYYYKKGITNGTLINQSQVLLWYPSAIISIYNDQIIIKFKNKYYTLYEFHQNFFLNQNLEYFLKPHKILNNIIDKSHNLIILLHCGNLQVSIELIQLIVKHNLNNYVLSITYYDDNVFNGIYDLIKNNFKQYYIIKILNLGTDIGPALVLYYNIKKIINFNYVLKLHTKTEKAWRDQMIIPLIPNLNDHINTLQNNNKINLICAKKRLVRYEQDLYCNDYLKELFKNIDLKGKTFCAGTVFISKSQLFERIFTKFPLISIKNLLFNTYYIKNDSFKNNSPHHTFERVFGYLTENSEINLGVK